MAKDDVGPGPLISHCIVRCPAPKLLNASTFWLCTLHSDQRIRLWNTDDGRCIAVSSSNLYEDSVVPNEVKMVALCALTGYPGQIVVFSNRGDLFVIDVYKMQLEQHLKLDSAGLVFCEYFAAASTLAMCDARGTIYLL